MGGCSWTNDSAANALMVAESARAREEGRKAGYEEGFKAGYESCLGDISDGMRFECENGQCEL